MVDQLVRGVSVPRHWEETTPVTAGVTNQVLKETLGTGRLNRPLGRKCFLTWAPSIYNSTIFPIPSTQSQAMQLNQSLRLLTCKQLSRPSYLVLKKVGLGRWARRVLSHPTCLGLNVALHRVWELSILLSEGSLHEGTQQALRRNQPLNPSIMNILSCNCWRHKNSE